MIAILLALSMYVVLTPIIILILVIWYSING